MSELADLVRQALAANGDLPVTRGVETWIEDGMQYTVEAIDQVSALIEHDLRLPVHERRVAPLDSWELWRWLAMGASGGWLQLRPPLTGRWEADGWLIRPDVFEAFYLSPVTSREYEAACQHGALPAEVAVRVELDRIRHGMLHEDKASVVLINRATTQWREFRVAFDQNAHLMARMRLNGHTAPPEFSPYVPPVVGARYITDRVGRWMDAGAVYTTESIDIVLEVMRSEALDGHLSGVGRFRTSMIGDPCLRKQQLSFLGWPKEQESTFALNRMENGSWGHLAWQALGLASGFLFDIEVMYEVPQWHVSGPMDGLCADGAGFELKTTNPRTFDSVVKSHEPKEDHLFQITTAMVAKGLSLYRVVYVNREDGAWVEIEAPLRTDYVDTLAQRMSTVLAANDERRLLPMYHHSATSSCVARKGPKHKNCDWRTVCSVAEYRRFV